MASYYFERALFVVGEPNSGKSNQLRSMFRDVRLGTGGTIPDARRVGEVYRLSNERSLYLRLTSPHEARESLTTKTRKEKFLEKTARIMEEHTPGSGKRWNFAGALQPHARHHMPGVVVTCREFVRYFNPERTRVVFLSPDRHGTCLQQTEHMDQVEGLRDIESVEVCWIDARDRTANGLLLADFFDFTSVEEVVGMEQLTQILQGATAAIGAEYFLLPIYGGDPVYRERVYCYELYHQMRVRWPDGCVYRLNGEVDKIGHPHFQDAAAPKPDLLVHQPGYGNNYAIAEVKSCQAAADGIRKDLSTLSRFGNEFGYQRLIYLIYGDAPEGILAIVQKCAVGLPHHTPIELWLHASPTAPAALAGNVA